MKFPIHYPAGSLVLLAQIIALSALPTADLRAEVVRCLTEPVDDVKMSSIVQGTIAVIHHGEGDFVEKGTVVLELESRSEQLDVQRRQVVLDNLRRTLERSETLLENSSAISIEEVDEARSEHAMAVVDLELAEDALLNKKVIAPFSGTITDIPLEVGEYCEPPQILLRMVDTRRFYCIANIDPLLASGLSPGDRVEYVPSLDGESARLSGEVVFISPVVDPASGLLRVKALFTNPNGTVRPGEGGFLELETAP